MSSDPPEPQARITRGKTARGRLELLDRWLCHTQRQLLQDVARAGEAVVDVGIGEYPWTTLDLARALDDVAPGIQLFGTELDPRRVRQARQEAEERFTTLQSGFDLPLPAGSVGLVRAMNVLRQYHPDDIPAHHAALMHAVRPGGLVMEGTSDKHGSILTAHLLERDESSWTRSALLFASNFERGFAPIMFQDWLPQDLRRMVRGGNRLHAFFAYWTGVWTEVRRSTRELTLQFERTAQRMAQERPDICPDPWLAQQGYLVWRPEGGVPSRAECQAALRDSDDGT